MPLPRRTVLPAAVPAPCSGMEVVEAVVHTGDVETRYQRVGRGAPVLLLCSDGLRGAMGAALCAALSDRFRLIAATTPEPAARPLAAQAGRVPVSRWLRDLIDGLGLIRPHLVADAEFGIAALGLALLDPERVDRLVLIRRDVADPHAADVEQRDALRRAGRALLLLRVDPEPGARFEIAPASVSELIRFLAPARGGGATGRAEEG